VADNEIFAFRQGCSLFFNDDASCECGESKYRDHDHMEMRVGAGIGDFGQDTTELCREGCAYAREQVPLCGATGDCKVNQELADCYNALWEASLEVRLLRATSLFAEDGGFNCFSADGDVVPRLWWTQEPGERCGNDAWRASCDNAARGRTGARCEEDCLERYPNNATELDELRYRFEVKIPNRFYALNAEVEGAKRHRARLKWGDPEDDETRIELNALIAENEAEMRNLSDERTTIPPLIGALYHTFGEENQTLEEEEWYRLREFQRICAEACGHCAGCAQCESYPPPPTPAPTPVPTMEETIRAQTVRAITPWLPWILTVLGCGLCAVGARKAHAMRRRARINRLRKLRAAQESAAEEEASQVRQYGFAAMLKSQANKRASHLSKPKRTISFRSPRQ
jgi:hypothetical protein